MYLCFKQHLLEKRRKILEDVLDSRTKVRVANLWLQSYR